jgi:uncharacterized membrane-anchored protein
MQHWSPMKLATLRPTLRHSRTAVQPGLTAPVRLDRRTKRLITRIRPGEIAVIDHIDLDRVAADALVACRVAAVVNAAPSISGRYPNLGPEALVRAGIPLVDETGPALFDALREEQQVRLEGGTVFLGDAALATGTLQDEESVAAAMAEARIGLATQLEAFAANTAEYLNRERDLLLDGVGVPRVRTRLEGRHALIVCRGYGYRQELTALRHYIREYRPVLIGVDGGADALVEEGYRPDLVVGDMESVTDEVLRCGAEVVVHAHPDGYAPGLPRVQDLGVEAAIFPAAATSEDIAMLLADDHGASLIVAVGTPATIIEFMDKSRGGMASTFLTRLRLGSRLVDANGAARLYRHRISAGALLLLVLAAVVAMAAALAVSPVGAAYFHIVHDWWNKLLFWLQGAF